MRATAEQVAAVLLNLWGHGANPERYVLQYTADYTGVEQIDQAPALGRQVADGLAAAGLQLGGLLRTDQGRFFAAVLEALSPRPLAVDERLIVDILTEASLLQTAGRRREARALAIGGAVLVGGLIYLVTRNP